MAKIVITEKDVTSPANVASTTDVVYVPGFATNVAEAQGSEMLLKFVPQLCEDISTFETYFGTEPAKFAASQSYPASFSAAAVPSDETFMFNEGDPDPSYIFAKELINAGIPVIYERFNGTDESCSVELMYSCLAGKGVDAFGDAYDPFENLKDKGEYSPKYITTGGYPNYEYSGDPKYTVDHSSETITNVSLDVSSFLSQVGRQDGSYVFEYADETGWMLEGESISLITYGIAIEGVPSVGDTITVSIDLPSGSAIVTKMVDVCATRGDCTALIDHTNNPDRPLDPNSMKSVFWNISNTSSAYRITGDGEFAAMFTPWCEFNCAKYAGSIALPGSFAYLLSLSKSIRTNPNWLAIAGVTRGIVPNLVQPLTTGRLTNAIADSYQPRNGVSINAITNIKPYGYTIWGNRTLKNSASLTADGLTATSFLNTRNMISDVKKVAYTAAKSLMFEQNSDVLWINFKAKVTPLLEQMLSGYGLSGYKLIKDTSSEKAKQKGVLVCTIKLFPIYAVEQFDITIEISDEEVSVS